MLLLLFRWQVCCVRFLVLRVYPPRFYANRLGQMKKICLYTVNKRKPLKHPQTKCKSVQKTRSCLRKHLNFLVEVNFWQMLLSRITGLIKSVKSILKQPAFGK